MFIGKKSNFDSCWRNEVSHFRLGQFTKVVQFGELYGPDVDNNTKNNSGSNETTQKVLALII